MVIMKFDPEIRAMVIEVMQKSRCQQYTPDQLCQLQKIIETQYFYYWSMDMKKEEYVCDLFTEDFVYNCFVTNSMHPIDQALRSKYVNKDMSTMHMCHQPLIWMMSDTTARGIFLYEDHHTYRSDKQSVSNYAIYCDDFRRCEDGLWRINVMRLGYRKMDGKLRSMSAPEGWKPKTWDEWKP